MLQVIVNRQWVGHEVEILDWCETNLGPIENWRGMKRSGFGGLGVVGQYA